MQKTSHNSRLRFWNFISIRFAIQCANLTLLSWRLAKHRQSLMKELWDVNLCRQRAANANDYYKFKFVISSLCIMIQQELLQPAPSIGCWWTISHDSRHTFMFEQGSWLVVRWSGRKKWMKTLGERNVHVNSLVYLRMRSIIQSTK